MQPNDRSYGTVEIIQVQPRRVRRSRNSSCLTWSKVCAWLTLLFLVLGGLLFATLYLLLLPWFDRTDEKGKPDFSGQNFAVGFDLTAGYGTAAVSFPNGTTIDISQTYGSAIYNKVIAKLSLECSQHPTPPYYGRGYRSDLPRQIRRKLRKAIGLPASKDVAALATVLELLKTMTEGEVGSFDYAFVTVPHLPALYNEDLIDACKYVGLQLLTLPWYVFRSGDQAEWPVTEVNTAMAGNDLGICEDFQNLTHCGEQIHCYGSNNVLSVLYTAEALTAHVSPICNSMHFYAAGGIANFSLGYNPALPSPNSYWPEIRSALRDAMGSYLDRGHTLGLVVAHGEGVISQPSFMTLLLEEVKKAQFSGELPIFTAKNPVYAGARGAAEFGKRCMLTDLDCIPDLKPRGPGW